MKLSEEQQEIIDTPGNIIVSASAGTGKTHTLVSKITKDLQENNTHKVIAAITFTVKAAKEIKKRMRVDTTSSFIGTNNRFAISEVIKPFARDVFNPKLKIKGVDYSIKHKTFNECLDYLKSQGIVGVYADTKRDFIFELALYIVKSSLACQLYLKSKYFKLYIDEYQDCDKEMHNFFMYICKKLKIQLFIVGDEKQSIYVWRGAYPEAMNEIRKSNDFSKKKLRKNFRSCQQIQNYSNLLMSATSNLYSPCRNKNSIILMSALSDDWADKVKQYLNLNAKCALLRHSNKDAKNDALELNNMGMDFTYIPKLPISEISTNVKWLYNAIAQYFIFSEYSIYDLIDDIPEKYIDDKEIIGSLQNKLKILKESLLDNFELASSTMENIASSLGYVTELKHIELLRKTVSEKRQSTLAFRMNELPHVATTVHSSKGLEYDQVIIFANDYDLDNENDVYNHYVAVTRAISKLIIIILKDDVQQHRGKQFCSKLNKRFSNQNVDLQDIMTIV